MKQSFQKEIKNIKNNPKSNSIMKKVIAIAAVVVIAILGLSSYNTNEVKKESNGSTLIARLDGPGDQVTGSNKKLD